MKELKLICDWNNLDKMTANKSDSGVIIIGVYGDDQLAEILFHKEKATQLRDWLNEFLGADKNTFTLHWIEIDKSLPKQTQSNRSVPVLVTINNRTVNTEACFDEGNFYLHGQC